MHTQGPQPPGRLGGRVNRSSPDSEERYKSRRVSSTGLSSSWAAAPPEAETSRSLPPPSSRSRGVPSTTHTSGVGLRSRDGYAASVECISGRAHFRPVSQRHASLARTLSRARFRRARPWPRRWSAHLRYGGGVRAEPGARRAGYGGPPLRPLISLLNIRMRAAATPPACPEVLALASVSPLSNTGDHSEVRSEAALK